ncbi:hypothetical protein CRI94_15860 [Longibacter salinarum]|uniref:N-acetyltransferase domain-containing protein n=1 Tax=Longibacter salinarum TaxID=1850348 RepID=A0A2A8CTU7_9BACT|nr:hypothetical protein CRI94_15860 [Longibacter salinarum]
MSPYRSGRAALRRATEVSYYVDARCRRQGIGSALMDRALTAAPGLDFDTVIAILLAGNDASIGLLLRFGFSEWGRLPDLAVFGEDRYDHLIYGCHVGDLAANVADDAG